MSDYNKPRDKAPPIEEPNRRYKKRTKKPFVIEWRYVGPDRDWFFPKDREWSTFRRYSTDKARQQALQTVRSKTLPWPLTMDHWEYRCK